MGKFIKKPVLTAAVVMFILAAILFIESQKPDISKALEYADRNDNNDNKKIESFIKEKNSKYPKAPDFVGIERWLNSEPLKIEQLRGKVVLVDFWTYTCINCIRTLPYLKDWDKKYRDKGLVIVGVHTPEFEFEKKYENVLKAVNDYQLKYAVAQDNGYATWSAYQNRYWPHKFLIDIDGYIRYDHIGEGGYEEMEKHIQELLNERMERLNEKNRINNEIQNPNETVSVDFSKIRTPEIYFGYQFPRGNFGNSEGLKPDGIIDYKFPSSITANNVYLEGKWKNNADNMELISDDGSILLAFQAKNANIVAGSENGSTAFVFFDNENKSISNINEFRLYSIANADSYDTHSININIEGKGFKIYTFTFG